SPITQTPTPLTNGLEHLHFADLRRTWAAAVRVPTGKGLPTQLSPHGRHVASYGTAYKQLGDIDSSAGEWLKVVEIETGREVWSRAIREEVKEIRWVTDSELLYCFNPRTFSTEPAAHVIRKLDPFSSREGEIYAAPR